MATVDYVVARAAGSTQNTQPHVVVAITDDLVNSISAIYAESPNRTYATAVANALKATL